MMLPQAELLHRTATRLRVRFPALKGDLGFFNRVQEQLPHCPQVASVRTNPLTGSVLILHGGDLGGVLRYAEETGLFALAAEPPPGQGLTRATLATYRSIDARIRRASGGELDLPQTAILAFIGTGIYQLARGRFQGPPWHSAFWYAMHLFMRSQENKRSQDTDIS